MTNIVLRIALTFCIYSVVAANVRAQDDMHQFNIQPDTVDKALIQLARQARSPLLLPSEKIEVITANPIRGRFTLQKALLHVLKGTGLKAHINEHGVITVTINDGNGHPLEEENMQRNTGKVARGVGLVAAVTAASAVNAKDQQGDIFLLEEIIVTATKRAESVDKVPVAINVMSGENLRTMGIASVKDLQNLVTGLNVTDSIYGLNLNIRGVTTTDTTVKGAQGIGFSVDGAPINRPLARGVAFFDVDRVEVLRGPQGTLYGAATTGGAINVVTKAPGDEFEANAKLEFGNYDTIRAQTALNIPLSENFAMRIAGNLNKRDGYLRSFDGTEQRADQDDKTIRASIRGHIGDGVTARVTLTAGQMGGTGEGGIPLGTFLEEKGIDQRRFYKNPIGSFVDNDFLNIDGTLDIELGNMLLTYIGSHQTFDTNQISSDIHQPVDDYEWWLWQVKDETTSHELRLSNVESGKLDYVLGATYMKEPIRENFHTFNASLANPTIEDSISGINPLNVTTLKSKGVFGQATFHVNESLSFVVGARYSEDSINRVGTFAVGPFDVNGNFCTPPDDCVGWPNNGSWDGNKFTYRLGVNYQASEDNLFYASVSTGYKPGGFNDFDATTGGLGEYGSEALTAYEAGYKGKLLDNVKLNSAVYHYDYSKAQISSLVNLLGNWVIYTRAVPAEISGFENELTWYAGPNTSINFNASVMTSKYKSFLAGVFQDEDWSGFRLDNTPKFVGSFAFNHAFPLSNGGHIRFRFYTKYSSSYFLSDFVAARQFEQDNFTRSDISLTYEATDNNYYIQAFIENIENNLQATNAPGYNDASLGGNLNASAISVTSPRFWGLRIGVNF